MLKLTGDLANAKGEKKNTVKPQASKDGFVADTAKKSVIMPKKEKVVAEPVVEVHEAPAAEAVVEDVAVEAEAAVEAPVEAVAEEVVADEAPAEAVAEEAPVAEAEAAEAAAEDAAAEVEAE